MHSAILFLRSNALWILLSLATLASFLWITKFKDKLKLKWYSALILAVLHTVLGVIAVKVFAFLETSGTAAKGSMSMFGVVFGMPILYFVGAYLFKRRYSYVYDTFSFVTIISLFSARVNCLISGCCLGIELSNGMRVPTREIELVYYFILLNLLYVTVSKDKMYGRAYPLFMFSYGIFRFIVEFFRETDRLYLGVFHRAHLWALISFIIGLCFFLILTKKHDEEINLGNKKKLKNK